ncbi:dynein light chain LC8-type protein [Rutstroemia sp. NJR-2017a WRK4]|nr:dynein light chain LC8-type protein [Rutstroemia sp. NJR-2017a WRK4]
MAEPTTNSEELAVQIKSADMIEDMQDEAVQVEPARKTPERRRREGIELALWMLTIETARQAMSKFSVEKVGYPPEDTAIAYPPFSPRLTNFIQDIAQHIKKTFDDKRGPTWHCIKRNTLSTSTSGTAPSSYSKLNKRLESFAAATQGFSNARLNLYGTMYV